MAFFTIMNLKTHPAAQTSIFSLTFAGSSFLPTIRSKVWKNVLKLSHFRKNPTLKPVFHVTPTLELIVRLDQC